MMLPRREKVLPSIDRTRWILARIGSRTFKVEATRAIGVAALPSVTWLPTPRRLLSGVAWVEERVQVVLDLSAEADPRFPPRFGLRLKTQGTALVVGAPGPDSFAVVAPADLPADALDLIDFLDDPTNGVAE